MFKGLNLIEFSETIATDDACRKYLSEIKWENGYQCGKLGSRQCVNCKYAESATARTLFIK
jgi:hypothetical protein